MTALSILEAARSDGRRDCLIDRGSVFSFSAVAERVRARMEALGKEGADRSRFCAIAPEPDFDSAITIYASIELGVPLVLLHPRWPGSQREASIAQAERSSRLDRDRCLAVAFTSGSTNGPRGAMLSRDAVVASAEAHTAHLGWRDNDRWLLCMPPAHVGGLSILTRCLHARRSVVLTDTPTFEPGPIIAAVADHNVTLMSLVPTMLHRLVDHRPPWLPPASLRAVLVGGASLSNKLRYDAVSRGVPVYATYGLSEACSQVATQTAEQVGTAGSGRALPGTGLRIQGGEIQVRGPTMMDGYLDGSESTRWTEDGWFRTGDLGRFESDGQLAVLGRADDLIVTGGENVMPRDVERALRSISGVNDACVFGLPDDEWGQIVCAALVVDVSFDRTRFAETMRERLAGFQRPRKWCIASALPLTGAGKVNRMQVAEAFAHRLEVV